MSKTLSPTEGPRRSSLAGTWFISDLHLCTTTPKTCTAAWAFFAALAAQATDNPGSIPALYLLGDLFETWIGDDDQTPLSVEFATHCSHLANLGVQIFIQHGNRDFLIGEKYAKQCSAKLLPTTHVAKVHGEQVVLVHGDELCTDDLDYQQLRLQLRSKQWQQTFLAQDIALREAQARQYREASQRAQTEKSESIMDVNEQATMQCLLKNRVSRMIHGHTHRPAIHRYAAGQSAPFRFRCVLGDWQDFAFALHISDHHIALKRWPIQDSVERATLVDRQPWHHLTTKSLVSDPETTNQ